MKFDKEKASLLNVYPSRVLIAGDWHGDKIWAKKCIEMADTLGADFILHVGDFGYNFDYAEKDGFVFNKPVQKELEKYDINLIWIDGNHDNHKWLQGLPQRQDGFVQTGAAGRVFWAPRGHRWSWSEVKFGALGGAYSINAEYLTEGKTLFSDLENIKESDIQKLGHEQLDILLTHEVAENVPVKEHFKLKEEKEIIAIENRRKVLTAIENTKPKYVFSGHWHQQIEHDITRVDGGNTKQYVLNNEHRKGSIILLDLFDYEIKTVF